MPQLNAIVTLAPRALHRALLCVLSLAVLAGTTPTPAVAQGPPPPTAAPGYPAEQLDAILAPIALYPDPLLTQVLMAAAYPAQITQAGRWLQNPANSALRGDALAAALAPIDWDPSVKSLVPFPQVLAMMNANLNWTQQLGYAIAQQQGAVMDSVQRLRRQAQIAGALRSTDQQVVRQENNVIVIEPAQPALVYVPAYNPAVVYGPWLYPAYPPVYLPPPPGYGFGPVIATGLAFGVGVAVIGGLWGWARPNWGGRSVYVDVNRFNTINVNRPPIRGPEWRPGGPGYRPPVSGIVERPPLPGGGFRPGAVGAYTRAAPSGAPGGGAPFTPGGGYHRETPGGVTGSVNHPAPASRFATPVPAGRPAPTRPAPAGGNERERRP